MKYINMLTLALSLAGLTAAMPLTASATTYDMVASPKVVRQIEQSHSLFIIRAYHAVVTEENGVDKMTLLDPNSNVVYFSDQPTREGGQIALSTFMNDWSQNAQHVNSVAPNATFLYQISDINAIGMNKGSTILLSNPVANSNGSWTFDIKSTSGQINLGRYHRPVLLIDTWNTDRFNPV